MVRRLVLHHPGKVRRVCRDHIACCQGASVPCGGRRNGIGASCSTSDAVLATASKPYARLTMASVLIRNVDETLHARLKAQAAAHRRSLEEEARELLRAAVARQAMP